MFVLAVTMLDGRPVDEILQLAMDEVPHLLDCRPEGCYMLRDGRFELEATPSTRALGGRAPRDLTDPVEQLTALEGEDGAVHFREGGWGWAVGLRSSGGLLGYLLVSAGKPPPDEDRFLVYALAQPTGAALYNAEARRRDREYARQLFRAIEERDAVNERLTALVAELEEQRTVHDVLARTSLTDEGEHGIAAAVYELTGLATRVEDRFGTSSPAPGRSRPSSTPSPIRSSASNSCTTRCANSVRSATRTPRRTGPPPRGALGSIELIDPDGTAGEAEKFALEHACTALSLELAHRRSLAEAELRLRRELVDDLLTGADAGGAYARAEAIGHDLHGPHHVTVAQWRGTAADDRFLGAVGRAAQDGACGRCWPDEATWRCSWSGASRATRVCTRPSPTKWAPRTARWASAACARRWRTSRAPSTRPSARSPYAASPPADGTTTCEELGLYRILARDKDAGTSPTSSANGSARSSTTTTPMAPTWCTPHPVLRPRRQLRRDGAGPRRAPQHAPLPSAAHQGGQRPSARRGGQPLQPPGRHPDLEGQRPRLLTARLAPHTRLTRTGRDRPPSSYDLGLALREVDDGRRLDAAVAGVEDRVHHVVEFLLDLPALGQRLLLIGQEQGARQQGLAELGEERAGDDMVGNPDTDRLLLRVQQPARCLLRRREDEGVTTRSRGLDRTEHRVVQAYEVGQLREVLAHQGEVVPVVQSADRTDPVESVPVAQLSPEGEAGVGRIGDEPAAADDVRHLAESALLGFSGCTSKYLAMRRA